MSAQSDNFQLLKTNINSRVNKLQKRVAVIDSHLLSKKVSYVYSPEIISIQFLTPSLVENVLSLRTILEKGTYKIDFQCTFNYDAAPESTMGIVYSIRSIGINYTELYSSSIITFPTPYSVKVSGTQTHTLYLEASEYEINIGAYSQELLTRGKFYNVCITAVKIE